MSDPFRDDEGAALIRAAKLEEENAELRRELAEAKKPKPPEPKPEPSDDGKLARARTTIALSMLILITGGGVFALTRHERAHIVEATRKSVESTPTFGKVTPIVTPPDWASQAAPTTVNLRAFTQGQVPAAGYAVGAGGTILRHYENAQAWTVEASGTTSDLAGVAEQLGNVCAVGVGGVATCTDSDQREWHVEKTGTKSDLLGVNASHGFLAVGRGGTIVRRASGGWRAEASGITTDLYAVEEPYAIGAGGVILQHGKGAWAPMASGTTEALFALDVEQHGVVVVGAHGTVLRLTDPRDGFHVESSGVAVDLFGVSRGDAGYDFIAAGASGTIIRSMNTGGIWRRETSGTSHDLHAVRGSIPTMFIVGDEATILSHRY